MRACFTLLAVTAAATFPTIAVSQGASHYYICSTRDAGKKIGYVSSTFADKPGDLAAIESQWKAMLTSKYGSMPFPSASCQEANTSAAAESIRDKLNDFMNDEGEKITATSWSYKPTVAKNAKGAAPSSASTSADPDNAEEWCKYNMPQIRTLFTCKCFAKIVADHRAQYPNEVNTEHGETMRIPFQSIMDGSPTRLNCKECMTDDHIAKWVEEMNAQQKLILQRMGQWDAAAQAKHDALNACLAKTFKRTILAEPYVDRVIPFYNRAVSECTGSRP